MDYVVGDGAGIHAYGTYTGFMVAYVHACERARKIPGMSIRIADMNGDAVHRLVCVDDKITTLSLAP